MLNRSIPPSSLALAPLKKSSGLKSPFANLVVLSIVVLSIVGFPPMGPNRRERPTILKFGVTIPPELEVFKVEV